MRQIDPQIGFCTLFSTLAAAAATPGRTFAPASPGRGVYHQAALRLRDGLDTLRLWQQRARGRQQLRLFDNHLLRDIGLTRLQAEAEADKPFWRA
jgi:uncharacterized protein YjiS (DUF1127 family)